MTRYYALGALGLALLAAGCGSEGKTLRTVTVTKTVAEAPATARSAGPDWKGVVAAHDAVKVPAGTCPAIGDIEAYRLEGTRLAQRDDEFFGRGPITETRKGLILYIRETRTWINFYSRALRVAVWCEAS